jgi:uncharacterized protein (UPF0332 family)
MAERINISQGYRKRAREELEASRAMLAGHFYAASISRAYYAVYYAISSLLVEKDIITKSHKQTAIEFRKQFIKTGQIERKYSGILDELFNSRMISDYDAIPEIDEKTVRHLLQEAHEFVQRVLS